MHCAILYRGADGLVKAVSDENGIREFDSMDEAVGWLDDQSLEAISDAEHQIVELSEL